MDRLTIEDFMIVTPPWQNDTTGYASVFATKLWGRSEVKKNPRAVASAHRGFPQRRVAVGLR
jgi:hypothetical protein